MSHRLSPAWLGLVFVLLGPIWIVGWFCWDITRLWVPVYLPISLAVGHLRTPEFEVNVASTYRVGVAVNWPSNDDFDAVRRMLGTDSFDNSPSVVGISWKLSSAGRILASGHSDGARGGVVSRPSRNLGNFYAAKGIYALDLEVERDGTGLNKWAPYLVVVENGNQRETSDARGSWGAVLLLLAPIGVVLLVRAANGRRIDRQNAWIRSWPLTKPGPQSRTDDQPMIAASRYICPAPVFPRRRSTPPVRPGFTRPAWIGLVMVLCYLVIDVPVWVFYVGNRLVPVGLPVHLMKTGSSQSIPGIQPLVVSLVLDGCDPDAPKYRGPRPCLYIDSQLVSWEDFDSVLQQALRLRPPNWPVYLAGDRSMEFRYAGEAIEKIRGLHAEVVLLGSRTPGRNARSR